MNELFQESQHSLAVTSEQLSVTSGHLATTREVLAKTAQKLNVTKQERDENKFLVSEHVTSEQSLLGQAEVVSELIMISINSKCMQLPLSYLSFLLYLLYIFILYYQFS